MISQKKYWEECKFRRSPDHCVVESFVKSKIDYISKYVQLDKTTKVLDVGCGNGFFTYYFSMISNTIGLDYSYHMLSINPCKRLIQGSVNLLPFRDCVFDIVFCANMLHHVKEPDRAVSEMKRVSNRYVILLEPNRNNPLMAIFSAIVKEERQALRYSIDYLKTIVENNNLGVIEACSLGSIAPNKTPASLIRLFRHCDKKMPFGFGNLIISQK